MSNGSTEQMKMTVGMDLGDNYSHLCLIDTQSGQLIEESRLRTTPEAMRRRYDSERPLHVAIEVGTHSPWVSRLLTECGHEVVIANAPKTRLIYGQRRKTDKLDALRSWPASLGPIRNFFTRWSTEAATPRLT
jgi:transposase